MERRRVRRYGAWPGLVFVAVLVLAAAIYAWVYWADAWPLRQPHPLSSRVQATVNATSDHVDRVEARLRLQLLATEMDRARRSTELRPGFRLVEEDLEEAAARGVAGPEVEALASLESLLVELTDERMSARQRLQRIIKSLTPPGGPGRQG